MVLQPSECRRSHPGRGITIARKPEKPLQDLPAPTDVSRAAVHAAKIGADEDIPYLSAALIDKYVAYPRLLGLV